MRPLIEKLLHRDEGFRRSVYTDHLGYYTIGIGRMVDAKKGGGVTHEEAIFLLRNDIDRVETAILDSFPWYSTLDEVRKAVLVSMAFQLGLTGLFAFRNTLQAVAERRFADAAEGMMKSLWARQTPGRALRLAEAMRTGDEGAFRLDEEPPTTPLPRDF